MQKKNKGLRQFLVIAMSALLTGNASASSTSSIYNRLNQGIKWTANDWDSYYTLDQGSLIMPYSWFVALKQPDGQLFLRDDLARYGYLQNPKSLKNPEGLPVGFLLAKPDAKTTQLSITCSACHTRQMTVNGVNYRADGGPAFSDIFNFLKDLDATVGYTLASPQTFTQFQKDVLAQGVAAPSRDDLAAWYLPYNTLISNSLTPTTAPWGIGRMDALSMIENRAAGLDIGTPADAYLIPHNIYPANVPVRYPFMWNAAKQDLTQWAGTSVNGSADYSLERNAGEVIGTFGFVVPQVNTSLTNGYDFLKVNSFNFDGLQEAEKLIEKIGPPKWPWAINALKAARGKAIYNSTCGPSCHEIQPGAARPPVTATWNTPILDVGTDTKYYDVVGQTTVTSGLLTGFTNPVNPSTPLVPATGASSVSLVGTLNQSILTQKYPSINLTIRAPAAPANTHPYESRVMQGIWAAAPYLHNGSVPTLAELLKPAKSRVKSFQVGPEYDTKNIGLAAKQPGGQSSVRVTTDCSDLNSGNSNCGHEFGTRLSESDKAALLEYLKTL